MDTIFVGFLSKFGKIAEKGITRQLIYILTVRTSLLIHYQNQVQSSSIIFIFNKNIYILENIIDRVCYFISICDQNLKRFQDQYAQV